MRSIERGAFTATTGYDRIVIDGGELAAIASGSIPRSPRSDSADYGPPGR